MPSIATHYLFAKKTFPYTDNNLFPAYALGAQGPDPFMAYGTHPLRKKEDKDEINPFGVTMHHLDIGPVYSKMEVFALSSPLKKKLQAYIRGLWSHYCMDRVFHPYVFYRSGFDENGNYAGIYARYHGYFEMLLDLYFIKEGKISRRNYKLLETKDEQLLHEISRMWAFAAPIKIKEDAFYESYLDYFHIERFLYSSLGFKRAFFRIINGKWGIAMCSSYPRLTGQIKKLDIPNLSHQIWLDPVSGKERNLSVLDLFEEAKSLYAPLLPLLENEEKGIDESSKLSAFYNHIDHDGTPDGQQKHYCHNCLIKQKKQ